jgi:beta-glucanase (GH16 family)
MFLRIKHLVSKVEKIFSALFVFIIFISSSCSNPTENEPDKSNRTNWVLVWNDEFDTEGLPDLQKWSYNVGGDGWGNNELQYYTENKSENARVQQDFLVIEARKENFDGNNYTSARLVSRGKGDWTYGRFEVRAVLPSGRGTWPAIWMLPTEWNYGNSGWPDNGEIDIMEHVGFAPGVVHASIHTSAYNWPQNTQKTSTLSIPSAQTSFHVYAMEWYPDSLCMFVDSIKYFTFQRESDDWRVWPFNKNFHFILNIAIGGNWGGQQGIDDNIFPARMLIDYVRVYKKD